MKQLKIAIGADHHGVIMKEFLTQYSTCSEYILSWIDVGAHSMERSDYPQYAAAVCRLIRSYEADVGILLCGTGSGMSIAANRFQGIYAAVSWQPEIAKQSKEDEHCNVLVLPADYISNEQAVTNMTAWLSAQFKQARYAQRLAMLDLMALE